MQDQDQNTTIGLETSNKTLSGRSSCTSCLLTLLVAAAAISALVFLALIILDPFCKRIRFGHRIKGSVTITLEGEPIEITGMSFTGTGVGKPKIKYNEGSVAFSILGSSGEEMYSFICELEALPTIRIDYFHVDSWDEFEGNYEFELHIEDDGGIAYKVHSAVRYDWSKEDYYSKEEAGTAANGVISINGG